MFKIVCKNIFLSILTPTCLGESDTDKLNVKLRNENNRIECFILNFTNEVMSLCLKKKSSKDGLEVMNKVIETYRTGKRVGRAQLSPGVDVYVCPNTETIITILAKNGFSKGTESFQDHQDSLIGCAVWRKDSSFNPQQVNGSDPSSAKTEVDAIPSASTEAPANDMHAINNIVKKMTEIEASIFRSLGIEKHQGNLQLLKTILPSSSDVDVKQPDLPTEDDDLPEYNFSSAVPHASTSNPLDSVDMNNAGLHVESQKNDYGGALPQKRIRNLFDEDDMPEWQPPDIKHFEASSTDQTTRPPFVPNTFRPPYSQMMPLPPPPLPPPQPPVRPPQFRPASRPHHGHYTSKPANHNRWSNH